MSFAIFDYINWLAVLCGALAYFMLGALWYSKILFAPTWLKLLNIDPNNPGAKDGMAPIMIGSLLLMFITSLGIAILRAKLEISGLESGLKLGLTTGLCFGVTAISISYLYEKRAMGLHLINGGYTLVGNIIAAIIICCWA